MGPEALFTPQLIPFLRQAGVGADLSNVVRLGACLDLNFRGHQAPSHVIIRFRHHCSGRLLWDYYSTP